MNTHFFRTIILFLSSLLPGLPVLTGQTGAVEAILQVDQVEDQITVRGRCHNGTAEDKALVYQLAFVRTDTNGNRSASSQGGEFELAAGGDLQLASTTVNLGEEPRISVYLHILERGDIIAADSFPKPEKPTVVPPAPSIDTEGGSERGAPSPDNNPDPRLQVGEAEFDGLVFEQTKTVWGQQFFQLFTQLWQAQNVSGDFTIVIEEAPFRGRTTIARVILNDEPILVRTLQAKYDYLEELAGLAVQVSLLRIQQLNQVQQDIEGEDLSGSGIY